jgi:hypothetical protein
MQSNVVFISWPDGDYSMRTYPNPQAALFAAQLALNDYPRAGVRVGDTVLRVEDPH